MFKKRSYLGVVCTTTDSKDINELLPNDLATKAIQFLNENGCALKRVTNKGGWTWREPHLESFGNWQVGWISNTTIVVIFTPKRGVDTDTFEEMQKKHTSNTLHVHGELAWMEHPLMLSAFQQLIDEAQ